MKFEAEYLISDKNGNATEKGKAVVSLDKENVQIIPTNLEPIFIPWTEIYGLSFSDYKVKFDLAQGKTLLIESLGYKFEDFARIASKFRNENLINVYLAEEPLKKFMIEGSVSYSNKDKELFKQNCELRIYETSLIVLPEMHNFVRMPFRIIKEIKEQEYSLEISTDIGEKMRIFDLGTKFDYFKEVLSSQINEMNTFVQKTLSDSLHNADPLQIRDVSKILKEGKIIQVSEINSICPDFLEKMEKRIYSDETDKKEYEYLKSLCYSSKISLGIKKGLMGSLSGDYFMFIFLINAGQNSASGSPGAVSHTNGRTKGKLIPIVAVESFSTEPKIISEGETTDRRATYFYRIPVQEDFKDAQKQGGIDIDYARFLSFFNTAMTAVNFRRFPILLSDARLNDPRYSAYSIAISRVPELKALRELYLGRVIHTDFKSWSSNISAIIEFAAKNPKSQTRWHKSGQEETEELSTSQTSQKGD
jgi:hypothetical protein